MKHPNIFFRTEELTVIQNQYSTEKQLIDKELDMFLSNVNSKEELIYSIARLPNGQEYMDSFKNTIYAIETFGKGSIANNRPLYVDPFSYGPFQDFNIMHPETMFYTAFIIGGLFLISLFNKWRITKLVGAILLVTIGLNYYNYYIDEPSYLVELKSSLNLEEYKESRMRRKAVDKYVAFYEPQIEYQSANVYEYNVEGYDENNNYFTGYVETSGKYGEGYLFDHFDNQIEIETEWISKGELLGIDNEGNEFYLSVSH